MYSVNSHFNVVTILQHESVKGLRHLRDVQPGPIGHRSAPEHPQAETGVHYCLEAPASAGAGAGLQARRLQQELLPAPPSGKHAAVRHQDQEGHPKGAHPAEASPARRPPWVLLPRPNLPPPRYHALCLSLGHEPREAGAPTQLLCLRPGPQDNR